ncbi:Phosphoenolpyruvate-protein phosphotransferase [Chlamydiales bacterium SCGC AB-751-O23]|jgi:phosphoenolpyruvate-protein phosphotransferase (PTS system enzyme I)|nr:Phosphoenolpyruvate-protein phosphotransferase [Chlamydiales bacterium SCGC AB-751-O23]
MAVKSRPIHLKGSPICGTIAIGKPFFFRVVDDVISEFNIPPEEIEGEIKRFHSALLKTRADIQVLQKQLKTEGSAESAQILDAHLQILEDEAITLDIEKKIKKTFKNTESIFSKVVQGFEEKFNKISSPFFKERIKDLHDVSRRLLSNLKKTVRVSLAEIPENSIVFADDLVPSDTAEAKTGRVSAFVTKYGGGTSHVAIMAKARGIPYISSVDFMEMEELSCKKVIVDARSGDVILNPDSKTLSKYKGMQKELNDHIENLEKFGDLEAETFDGYKVRLAANIENHQELDQLIRYGDHGIGLFRSEYLFLSKSEYPSEEEQLAAYRQILEKMSPLPVVIRTFDLGGDKLASFQTLSESNPFLGCRAIRLMLRETDIFKTQLRAILRASVYGNVKILFPMVSGLVELNQAKAVLEEVRKELRKKGIKFDENIPIGCMIEVPSAAITCDMLVKECDFLSIGTNDLVQYSLAVDRGNEQMSYLYRPTDPSVLRLIKIIVDISNKNKVPVGLCGEIAANPLFTPLLLGLGIHELSVAARFLPSIKSIIRSTSIVSAVKLAENILNLPTADEVEAVLVKEYQKIIPNDPLLFKSEGKKGKRRIIKEIVKTIGSKKRSPKKG